MGSSSAPPPSRSPRTPPALFQPHPKLEPTIFYQTHKEASVDSAFHHSTMARPLSLHSLACEVDAENVCPLAPAEEDGCARSALVDGVAGLPTPPTTPQPQSPSAEASTSTSCSPDLGDAPTPSRNSPTPDPGVRQHDASARARAHDTDSDLSDSDLSDDEDGRSYDPEHECEYRADLTAVSATLHASRESIEQAEVLIALSHVPHGIQETARLRAELVKLQSDNMGLRLEVQRANARAEAATATATAAASQASTRPRLPTAADAELRILEKETLQLRQERTTFLAERAAARTRAARLVRTLDEVFGALYYGGGLHAYEPFAREALARLYNSKETEQDFATLVGAARASAKGLVPIPVAIPVSRDRKTKATPTPAKAQAVWTGSAGRR
ncbi:hypothetical protein MKEN_00768800 [Mycena kentingensis (nom. inval.)]|nr:hypothetical protein MKEN_00768800 [Mycena kentingensis (nom. inval.)]